MDEFEALSDAVRRSSERPRASASVLLTTRWNAHLELLEHLCHYSRQLLIILGPEGSGRSTFLKVFLERETVPLQKTKISLRAFAHPESVIIALRQLFPPEEDLSKKILLVDDVDGVQDSILLTLLKWVYDDKKSQEIHMVLFADESLENKLLQTPFVPYVQGRVQSLELEPFTFEEAKTLLTRKSFDNDGFLPVRAEDVPFIFEAAEGWPGRMVALAHSQPKRTKYLWRRALPIGAGILTAIFAVSFGTTLFNKQKNTSIAAVPPALEEKHTASDSKKAKVKKGSIKEEVVKKDTEVTAEDKTTESLADKPFTLGHEMAAVEAPVLAEPDSPVAEEVAEPLPPFTYVPDPLVIPDQKTEIGYVPNDLPLPRPELEVAELIDPAEAIEPAAPPVAKTAEPEPPAVAYAKIAKVTEADLSEEVMPFEDMPNTGKNSKKAQARKSDKSEKIASKVDAAKVKNLPTEKVLAQKEKTALKERLAIATVEKPVKDSHPIKEDVKNKLVEKRFSLQIMASPKESSLKQFMSQHALKGARTERIVRNGEPWYVLLYGQYATREEAEAAVRQLPEKVRSLKPWVRAKP